MQIAGARAQFEQGQSFLPLNSRFSLNFTVEKTLRLREGTLTSYQERIEKLTQEKVRKKTVRNYESTLTRSPKENLLDGNQRNSLQIQSKVDELDRLMSDEKRQHLETQQHAKVYK